MSKRLMVIGLDCVTPQLLYSSWLDDMPNIKRLMGDGLYGNLVSTCRTDQARAARSSSMDSRSVGA